MIPKEYADQADTYLSDYMSTWPGTWTSVDGSRSLQINSIMEMELSDTLLVYLTLTGQDFCQVYPIRCYPYQFRGLLTDAARWLRGDPVESVIRAINGERVSQ